MVGKQGIAKRTRSKKFSNSVNAKTKSPKKVGASGASTSAAKRTKKQYRKADDSAISILSSSSPERETDDSVEFLDEEEVGKDDDVELLDEETKTGKRNGEKSRATKKGVDKQNGIKIKEAKAEPEKKKMNEASRRQSEGKKEDKKKLKKVEAEEQLSEEVEMIGAIKQRDKKRKGKEVEAKWPEKSKKRSDVIKPRTEGEKGDKKKKVGKMEEQTSEAGQQDRRGKKEDKKDKKKKNRKVEIVAEDEEENEKSNNALYKFPMNRVSRMIKSEDISNKIAQEAVFVINKASEKFLELFCREAYACAFLDHKNHIAYNHLSSVVSKRRRFDFLSDFVPEKVKAEAALAEMSDNSKAET